MIFTLMRKGARYPMGSKNFIAALTSSLRVHGAVGSEMLV
jgi:hypothetical protein